MPWCRIGAPRLYSMAMSQTAGSSFAPGTTGFGSIASAGTTGMPKRKQASVVEMLEYVKSLNIDPIREADMLWIAEEAFNAPLPPGWTEHQDEQCRVYFHNSSTGESTWKHPMDDLFREIVDYQRRVVEVGGFWQIEDEIAEQEENIRKDLADWMELFSEDGEKFFYNKHTEESRFDDPRMAVYHVLYARIKMVARMKERFPILARQPRPEEPTEAEKELRRRREEDREHYMSCLLKIQTWGRVLLAKKKLQRAREKAIVQKGPQPLRGMLRLRLERVGATGAKQLVLSQTTPAKRHRAAVKIQKRMRGILTRKRFQPLVRHRCFLSKEMTKIQSMARVWLARRKVARKKQQKLHVAATKVQRTWRGYKDRQYVTALRIDKARYDRLMRSAIVIQSGVRMALARREHDRRKLIRWAGGASTIQRQARIFLQRKELHELALKDQPVQAMFTLNTNGMHRTVMPWTWRVFVAPWAGEEASEEASAEENGFVDIFNKVGVSNWQTIAVVNCQKMVRGFLSRIRTQRLKTIALCSVRSMVDGCLEEVTRRKAAAIKIQSIARGFLVRRKNLIYEKRNAAWEANVDNIVAVQAFFRRYLAQEVVVTGVLNNTAYFAATMIQTSWRGWLARRHVERLREEALWPLKGWFEFTATGRDAVQVEVCFLANPSFNDYKYFLEYGSTSTLQLTLKELEKDLASAITAVQGNQFLKDDMSRRPSASKDRSSKARPKPKSESRKEDGKEQRSEEAPQDGEPKVEKKEAKNKGNAARETPTAKEQGKAAGETADPASPGGQSESGKKASKPPKDSEAAQQESPVKPKAAAKGSAKAEARKAEAGKKETSSGEAQPPKPESAQPKPPTLGADASVREMSQSTQANELRKTASGTVNAPAEQGAAAAGVESVDVGSVKPKPAEKPPNPNQGKNYAGAIKNGKFEKKKVDSIEELSKDERAAIMVDIEEEKQKKLQALQEKQKQQQKKKKQQEAKVQEAQRSQMEQAEAQEEERRKQKVQELKKWLKQKEDQDRAKKERDAVLLQELQEKEVQKQEQQKVLEQARQEQRDKRLQAVAKQKAKLEAQLLASREAAIQEKINASQRSETKPSGDAEVSQESMENQPPEETDPRMRKQQLLIQQQLGNERGYGPGMPGMPGMPQRIVHRHIHHHVHYHEGDGEEPALPSMEERRRIEQASEDRVKQKLAEQGMGEMDQGFGPHGVDPIAETPTMQQSRSLPALHSRSVQRTQEGPFRLLPDINAREIGAKHGVPNFGQSVDRAIQSYANSGRPRFVKSGMAPPPR